MKLPDKSEFAKEILQKNAYTFFHLVPTYYQFFTTRNMLEIKPIIDSVTHDVIDSLTTRTYSIFFSRPPEPHVIYQEKMDEMMKKSGCENPSRVIPKEIEDSFQDDENGADEKEKNKPPQYKTLYIDDMRTEKNTSMENEKNDVMENENNENSENDNGNKQNDEEININQNDEKTDDRKHKLNKLIESLKGDAESNASDELDDALPPIPAKESD